MTPEEAVERYLRDSLPDDRYSSFDYCYNYFRSLARNTVDADLEKASSILGFYLASWGMMRGSSFLLHKSSRYLVDLVRFLNSLDKDIWNIGPNDYLKKKREILELYKSVSRFIVPDGSSELTLVTKVLLGTLGIVPAFDSNFCKFFRTVAPSKSKFSRFTSDSLDVLFDYYQVNRGVIDRYASQTFTKDFTTCTNQFSYPRAKIIDMIGFVNGTSMP